MEVQELSFGKIVIDGKVYDRDIVISNGKTEFREKSVSRMMKGKYGHTPLTIHENIPWDCEILIVGTGMYGSLPVTEDVYKKAKELDVELILKRTKEAAKNLNTPDTNFVLHITC